MMKRKGGKTAAKAAAMKAGSKAGASKVGGGKVKTLFGARVMGGR